MRPLLLLPLFLAACGFEGVGQKVTVLLRDVVLPCEVRRDAPSIAVLRLDQPEDFYQVEFVDAASGSVATIGGVRSGLDVTFACPEGFEAITVRHATVLQERVGTPADDGSDDDDGGAPAPTAR